MIIRKATIKDFEKLNKLKKEFFKWECEQDKRINPAYINKGLGSRLARNLKSKKVVFFVADDKGELVAYAGAEIEKNPKMAKYEKRGHLFNLYVIPKFRGKKIGEQLTKEVLKWFKQKKLKDQKIMVYTHNKRAHNLYKKVGFKDYIIEMKK